MFHRTRALTLLLALLLAGSLLLDVGGLGGTTAFFTAATRLGGNTVQAAPSFAPTLDSVSVASLNVTLNWTAPTGGGPWVAGYRVLRGTTTGGPYIEMASLGAATLTYTDSATANGVTYYYVVRAVSNDGGSATYSNELSATPDNVAPSVTNVNPPDAQTGVVLNTVVTVTFNEAMNQISVWNAGTPASSAFCLFAQTGTCAANRIAGTGSWSADSKTFTFTPSTNLGTNTWHSVSVTTGALDLAGNPLGTAFTSAFRTAVTVDTARPYITTHSPTVGQTAVATNASVVLNFNEAMNVGTTESALCVSTAAGCTGTILGGFSAWSADSAQISFDPVGLLAASTTYYVRILGSGAPSPAADVAGNALCPALNTACTTGTGDYSYSFTTGTGPAPTIVWTSPVSGEDPVNRNANIFVNFSEAMNQTSVWNAATPASSAFCLYQQGSTCAAGRVAGTGTWSGTLFTFDPGAQLLNNRTYVLEVTTAATNAAGAPLANLYSSTFFASNNASTTDALTYDPGAPRSTTTGLNTNFAPGSMFTMQGTGWPNNVSIEIRWDDSAGTLLGTATSTGTGTFTTTGLIVPFDSTNGAHNMQVRALIPSGKSTVSGVSIFYPELLTVSATESGVPTDNKLYPGQTGIVVTAALQRGGSPYANAGVKFLLSTVPASPDPACDGANAPTFNPSSGTLQQTTTAAGEVSVSMSACGQTFTAMTVQTVTGGGLSQAISFADPPPPPPAVLTATPGSIHLNWTPSDAPPGRVTGYLIHVGTKPGIYDRTVPAGPLTSFVFNDGELPAGVDYYFTVSAYDERGRTSEKPSKEAGTMMPFPVARVELVSDTPRIRPGGTVTVRAKVVDTRGAKRGANVRFVVASLTSGVTLSGAAARADQVTGEASTTVTLPAAKPGELLPRHVAIQAMTEYGIGGYLEIPVEVPGATFRLSTTGNRQGSTCFGSDATVAAVCDSLFSLAGRKPGEVGTASVTLLNDGVVGASTLRLFSPACTPRDAAGEQFHGSANPCEKLQVYVQEWEDADRTRPRGCVYGGTGPERRCAFDERRTLASLSGAHGSAARGLLIGRGLAVGKLAYLSVGVRMDPTGGNAYQGRAALADLSWYLGE